MLDTAVLVLLASLHTFVVDIEGVGLDVDVLNQGSVGSVQRPEVAISIGKLGLELLYK